MLGCWLGLSRSGPPLASQPTFTHGMTQSTADPPLTPDTSSSLASPRRLGRLCLLLVGMLYAAVGLLLTDVVMPGEIGGLGTARRQGQHSRRPGSADQCFSEAMPPQGDLGRWPARPAKLTVVQPLA